MNKITKDEFLKIRSQSHLISGIHNYCDKWCERCPKTGFCSVFSMEKEFKNEESEDKCLGGSLEIVSNMFEITFGLLQEMMEKHEIVITDEDLALSEIVIKNEREFSKNHPLNKMGHTYFQKTDEILTENLNFFKAKIEKTATLFADEKEKELLSLQDSFEVIRWYCTLLPAKIYRGVGNLFDKDDLEEDWAKTEFYGTFKVALISAQRSIVAWAKVLETFPEKEDEILPALVYLEKIINGINEICPQANYFKRPGLD